MFIDLIRLLIKVFLLRPDGPTPDCDDADSWACGIVLIVIVAVPVLAVAAGVGGAVMALT